MDLNNGITLIVKVQQFEDKRIEAKASWNIKELKGKLSEIYPTKPSTEEQKLIYSGKLLNDTVILKDVLRQYDGQEAHTVHLVFTPKFGTRNSKYGYDNNKQHLKQQQTQSTVQQITNTTDMSTNGLRQRQNATNSQSITTPTVGTTIQAAPTIAQPVDIQNIPSNILNAYVNTASINPNDLLAQQFAMQNWMQQAYTQYMSQYMNMFSSSNTPIDIQNQQQSQQQSNMAFMQPFNQIFGGNPQLSAVSFSSNIIPNATTSVAGAIDTTNVNGNSGQSTVDGGNNSSVVVPQPQAEQAPVPAQPRFPNIVQEEQENRDWLDILYAMSRLFILLCLVYFYSSPMRCLIVILAGISIYLYNIYKHIQNGINNNNNNNTRVNNNNLVPPRQPVIPIVNPAIDDDDELTEVPNGENIDSNESDNDESLSETVSTNVSTVPLITEQQQSTDRVTTEVDVTTPNVPLLVIVKTFILSFFASIIPEAPAL